MKLTAADHQAIAERVVALMRLPASPTDVLNLGEAMKRIGVKSSRSFHRWCKKNKVTAVRGTKGRYTVASLNLGLDREKRRY